jgi:hypothetical protein
MKFSYLVSELYDVKIEEIEERGNNIILKLGQLSIKLKDGNDVLQDYKNKKEIKVSGNIIAEHVLTLFPFHFQRGKPQIFSGRIYIDDKPTYKFSRASNYVVEKV